MDILIGLLTFILFFNALVLIFLVLIQLPKKEAGMGTAFGGGAMTEMFGAHHGTVLTTATKYSATLFLALCLGLSWLHAKNNSSETDSILEQMTNAPSAVAPAPKAPSSPPPTPEDAKAATKAPEPKQDAPAEKSESPASTNAAPGAAKSETEAAAAETAAKPKEKAAAEQTTTKTPELPKSAAQEDRQ